MPRKRNPPKSGRVGVRILRDHDHKLTPGMVLAFKAGTEPREIGRASCRERG